MLRRNGRRKAPRSAPHRTVHDGCASAGPASTDDDDDTTPRQEERHRCQSIDRENNNEASGEHCSTKRGNSSSGSSSGSTSSSGSSSGSTSTSSSSSSSCSIKRSRSVLGGGGGGGADDDNDDGDQQQDNHRPRQETGDEEAAAAAGEGEEGASKRQNEDGPGSSDSNDSSANGIRETSHLPHMAGAEYGEQAIEVAEGGQEGYRPIEDSTAAAVAVAMTPHRDGKDSGATATDVKANRTGSASSAQGSGGLPIDFVTQRDCIIPGAESGSDRGSGADGEVYTSPFSSSSCQGLLLEDIELVNLHNLSLHKLEGMEKLIRLRVADLSGNELHDTAPLRSCACLEVRFGLESACDACLDGRGIR